MRIGKIPDDLQLLKTITKEKYMRQAINFLRCFRNPRTSGKLQLFIEENVCWFAVCFNKTTIRIMGIAVAEEKRSLGIGTQIVNKIKNMAQAKNLEGITLRADPAGRQFIFWLRQGFKVTRELEDDVEMKWTL